MKKIIALAWIGALCLGLLLYSIFDRPAQTQPKLSKGESTTVQQTTLPTDGSTAALDQEKQPIEPDPVPPSAVRIQIRNDDPDRQAAWEAIAADYTAATGVEVVVSAEGSPTLYAVSSADELGNCQDLSGTAAYSQLADMGLALTVEGKVCGIAAEVECFGLIYNEDLMAAAGHSKSDIYDLNSFTQVVLDIVQQGYLPFAGLDNDETFNRRLASLPGDIRSLIDLWSANCSFDTETTALERFMNRQAVFYLGSTDEYEIMSVGGSQTLGILPVYMDNQNFQSLSLCVMAEQYWCVNAEASEEEIQAALAFLDHLVVPGEDGTVPVDRLEILAPYRQATYCANSLEVTMRQELAEGKSYVICEVLSALPEGFIEALRQYTLEPTDENWQKVEQTLSK